MAISLGHTTLRTRDRHRSARFFADLLGLDVGGPVGPFASVRVNEGLTFLFDDQHEFLFGHYAFLVDEGTFDAALARLEGSATEFGSGPGEVSKDHRVGRSDGGRVVYARDPDGNSYELRTRMLAA